MITDNINIFQLLISLQCAAGLGYYETIIYFKEIFSSIYSRTFFVCGTMGKFIETKYK